MGFRDKELRLQLKKLQRIENIWDNKDYNEAVRKAKRMSAHDMLSWIDNHISDIGKAVDDYKKYGLKESLLELRKAVSILQALTEELMAADDAGSM